MRSTIICLLAALLLIAVAAPFVAAQAPPPPSKEQWFDLKNCEMCKPLLKHPELMHNMSWEHHNITNGIVSVTTVREPFMKHFKEAQVEMGAISNRLSQGEQLPLCQSCVAFGQCVMKGATVEQVDTKHGALMMITSENPEVVGEIQAWAQRSNDEMKKMEAMEKKMMKEMHEEHEKHQKTEKEVKKEQQD